MSREVVPYHVLRDTAEHAGHGWTFSAHDSGCTGTRDVNLYTGDYSLDGYYDDKTFVIERKGRVSEFVQNITVADKWRLFKDELERLEEFKYPFIVLEFPFSLLEKYPVDSGIPQKLWPTLRTTSKFLIKRLLEIELKFKTKIIFADQGGKRVAESLFKRVVETCGR